MADALLAVLWLAGGTLWEMELSPHSRVACLAISTATVVRKHPLNIMHADNLLRGPLQVLECVTINLSLVYALFALAHLRASRLPSALFYVRRFLFIQTCLLTLGVCFSALPNADCCLPPSEGHAGLPAGMVGTQPFSVSLYCS